MRFINNISKQPQSNDIKDYAILKEHPKTFPYYVKVETCKNLKNLIGIAIDKNTYRNYEHFLLVDFQGCDIKTLGIIHMYLHDGGSLRAKFDGKSTKRFIRTDQLVPIEEKVKNICYRN